MAETETPDKSAPTPTPDKPATPEAPTKPEAPKIERTRLTANGPEPVDVDEDAEPEELDVKELAEARTVRANLTKVQTEYAKMIARNGKTPGFYSDVQLKAIKGEVGQADDVWTALPKVYRDEVGGLGVIRGLIADEMTKDIRRFMPVAFTDACKRLNRSVAEVTEDGWVSVSMRLHMNIKGNTRKPPKSPRILSLSIKGL